MTKPSRSSAARKSRPRLEVRLRPRGPKIAYPVVPSSRSRISVNTFIHFCFCVATGSFGSNRFSRHTPVTVSENRRILSPSGSLIVNVSTSGFMKSSLALESETSEHSVEVFGASRPKRSMRQSCCLLEVAFVHFYHALRRSSRGNRRRLQNFMIQRNRDFFFIQIGAQKNVERGSANPRLSNCCSLNRIEQGIGGHTHLYDLKTATQRDHLKRRKVEHPRKMADSRVNWNPDCSSVLCVCQANGL